MGNADSTEQEHPSVTRFDGVETLGSRVLGVQPNSPASRAGLVSFFDFLVGVNGQIMFGCEPEDGGDGDGEFYEDVDFPALLKGSINQEIELLVYNIKSQTQRLITLTPSTSWGGAGLLGVTIRTDDYSTAEENLLRILSVSPRSPAALAGLTPLSDFLLGTAQESFENEGMLANILETFEDEVLEVYVYNTESDVVRVVTIVPTIKWGGGGLLGAEVGRGYLHRLPKACRGTLGVSFERKVKGHQQMDVGGDGTMPVDGSGGDGHSSLSRTIGTENNTVSNRHSADESGSVIDAPATGLENYNTSMTTVDRDEVNLVSGKLSKLNCSPLGQEMQGQESREQQEISRTSDEDKSQTAVTNDSASVPPPLQQSKNPTEDNIVVDSGMTNAASFTYSLPPMPKLQNTDNSTDTSNHDTNTKDDSGDDTLDLPPPPFTKS